MTAQLPSTEYTLEDLREIAYRGSYDDMQRNLARALLAAHEQEPVAWQYRVSAGKATGWSLWHNGNGEEYEKSYQVERRPLYARPAPVPAVPDECINAAYETHLYGIMSGTGNKRAAVDFLNECLAAAAKNHKVTP